MNEILITEQTLLKLDRDLDSLLLSVKEHSAIDFNDTEYGIEFRRYLLFSRWPDFLEKNGLRTTDEELLYNSYYWMLKFSKLYERKHGYNAGIEQQAFKIFESTSLDVDWNVVEQLTNLVDTELGERS